MEKTYMKNNIRHEKKLSRDYVLQVLEQNELAA